MHTPRVPILAKARARAPTASGRQVYGAATRQMAHRPRVSSTRRRSASMNCSRDNGGIPRMADSEWE